MALRASEAVQSSSDQSASTQYNLISALRICKERLVHGHPRPKHPRQDIVTSPGPPTSQDVHPGNGSGIGNRSRMASLPSIVRGPNCVYPMASQTVHSIQIVLAVQRNHQNHGCPPPSSTPRLVLRLARWGLSLEATQRGPHVVRSRDGLFHWQSV
jgi:hypothetical protein